MDARAVAETLDARGLSGVRFVADPFTPESPGDGKFPGQRIPGVRIDVTSRDHVQVARVGAAILWALRKLHADSLTISGPGFDQRMGSAGVRDAIMTGADPDAVIDLEVAAVAAWQRRVRPFVLYR
jgi:uncharacterized protein YbbC (DUF1343 family)